MEQQEGAGDVPVELSGTSASSITAEVIRSKLGIMNTRTEMLEGYVRNRPQALRKASTEVLREIASLDVLISNLDDVQARNTFSAETVKLRDVAMHYYEAATGLDFDDTGSGTSLDQFKLRKCAPPTFDGNVRHFIQWWEHFESAVHLNPQLEDKHRIIHLLSSLRGEAKEFLRSFPATGESYNKALDALRTRFGDPTKLSQCFYSDLAVLPDLGTMPDGSVTVAMDRANLDEIKTIILGLRSTNNIDAELIQGWILRKISRRRITAAFVRLSSTFPKLTFDLDSLLEAIESAIYIDEVIDLRVVNVSKEKIAAGSSSVQGEVVKATTLINKISRATGASFRSASYSRGLTSSGRSNDQGCLFCSGRHASTDCRAFSTFEARKARLNELKRCRICLSSGHTTSCSDRYRECRICGKTGHSSPMCFEAISKLKTLSSNRKRKTPENRSASAPSARHHKRAPEETTAGKAPAGTPSAGSGTFLETFVTVISVNNRTTSVRGMFDGGSTTSYIHCNILKRLQISAGQEFPLAVQSYGSQDLVYMSSSIVQVTFLGLHGLKKTCNLFSSNYIVDDSSLSPPPQEVTSLLPSAYTYADPDLFCPIRRPIEILIGNDCRNLFMRLNRDKRLCEGLLLRPTIFGWIPSGKVVNNAVVTQAANFEICAVSGNKVVPSPSTEEWPDLTFLWQLEALGIKRSELNNVDDSVLEYFRRTTRFENGRYIVCWPRRSDKLDLPTHFRMCVAQLKSLLRRTSVDVLARWNDIILEQLQEGVIERAPRESRHITHYLPQQPLVKEGKMRIVSNASARTKMGSSLNDKLHTGPSLIGNLVELLLNFRLYEVGVSADIEKAFLQVGLNEADRDLVRFVWVDDFTQPVDKVRIIAYRFTRTPFGVVSSPFLLNMVLQEHLAEGEDNPTFQLARKLFYVDNFVLSVENVAHALQIFELVTDCLAQASFNIRDWTSNYEEFNNALPPEKLLLKEDPISILGLRWNRKTDSMSLCFKEDKSSSRITLRSTLSALASVFDPLGLVAPCLLDLKLLVQSCWKAKVGWDELLPSSMQPQYLKLLRERDDILSISVPRYLWKECSRMGSYDLHVFCDASKLAYGCAVYLVHQTAFGNESRLIFSKVRIAPIQERSIPQLELLAALIGKRAVTFVKNALELVIAHTILWTDATTVLQWLHSTTVQAQFVQNRLIELRQANDLTFRYVPTKDNPADILSRGQKASMLQFNNLWWLGPSWLPCERLWPTGPSNTLDFTTVKTVTLIARHTKIPTLLTDQFEARYSSWSRSVRQWLRAWKPLRWLYHKANLTSSESYRRAELALLRLIQQKYFAVELKHLQSNTRIFSDLQLFLHSDGLIHCRSRLETAPMPWDMVNPILLPRESTLVRKIIDHYHRSHCHAGTETTLAAFRSRFWVTKGRSLVKSVIHRCDLCRRWRGGPFQLPPPPPLPRVRTAPVVPFLNVGLDNFGPLYVREHNTSLTSKIYGVIFTCLVTRAVHLEIVDDLSGQQFLLALIRFSKIRRTPKFVVSDNGRNFTFMQPLLGHKVELTYDKLDAFVTQEEINWHFIPAYSPWQGGVYERMIGLVKESLLRALGSKIIDRTMLATIFCEVADIVNSRPLTYLSPTDIVNVLTPNTFLRLSTSVLETEMVVNPATSNSQLTSKLLGGYKELRNVVEYYRSVFYSHYLRLLREKHSRMHSAPRGAIKFSPRVGAMVLAKHANISRAKWPLAVIEKLDRRNAQATIRIIDWVETNKLTPDQLTNPSQLYITKVINLPVSSLYPLELPLRNLEMWIQSPGQLKLLVVYPPSVLRWMMVLRPRNQNRRSQGLHSLVGGVSKNSTFDYVSKINLS